MKLMRGAHRTFYIVFGFHMYTKHPLYVVKSAFKFIQYVISYDWNVMRVSYTPYNRYIFDTNTPLHQF